MWVHEVNLNFGQTNHRVFIACRKDRIGVIDCISLSLGAEYIGVHDLEGKKPLLHI